MLAIASAPLALPPTLFTSDNTVLASRFANVKLKHSRSYESAAKESARYSIFVENLKLVDKRTTPKARSTAPSTASLASRTSPRLSSSATS